MFSLAFLLSTVFTDIWRPLLITLLVAIVVGLAEAFSGAASRFGTFAAMSGETFFRARAVPWTGLLISAVASAVMLWTAARNVAARDF